MKTSMKPTGGKLKVSSEIRDLSVPPAPERTDLDMPSKMVMVKRTTTNIILDLELPNFDYGAPAEVGHDDWRVYFVPKAKEFCCVRFHRVHGTEVESDFKFYDRARTAADLMNAAESVRNFGLEY